MHRDPCRARGRDVRPRPSAEGRRGTRPRQRIGSGREERAGSDGRRPAPAGRRHPGGDPAQRAVVPAAGRRAGVPLADPDRPRRLGPGRADGLRHHRLPRRQDRPPLRPGLADRPAARPARRPALHRLDAVRPGLARRSSRGGWSPSCSPARSSWQRRCCSCVRRYGYVGLPVHFVGKAATFNLLYAFPLLLLAAGLATRLGRGGPAGRAGRSRGGGPACTGWPASCTPCRCATWSAPRRRRQAR